MARRLREDCPGAKFHVMNRGVARRTIFDAPSDYRFFLACLARAVRRKEIVLLAFALLRTHFHLLVRSLGGLSAAMQRTQLRHARRFNRLRRRDGPLMRSRFLSKRIDAYPYERNVVHYTHENPVLAGLCTDPSEYRWSSAWLCAQQRVPRWFTTESVDRCGVRSGGRHRAPSAIVMRARAELVETRLRARGTEDEVLLDGPTPARVRDWMRRKARLADGYTSALPQVGPRTLCTTVERILPVGTDAVTLVPGAQAHPTRDLLLAGMLRDLSCCSMPQIARLLEQSVSRVKRLSRLHGRCLIHAPGYAELATRVASACLELLEGPPPREEGEPGTDQSA